MKQSKTFLILSVLLAVSICQLCSHSHFFNGQRCAPCKDNCLCTVEDTCSSCMKEYTFTPDFQSCVKCP